MKNNEEKIKKILEKVDLTETQRNRAIELYTNVCNSIEEKSGLNINFYPQGSFATRTAIRPYKNGRDQAYDVDVICEVELNKEEITPDGLKGYFREALNSSRYSKKMVEWDKCFTIDFEERDGVSFSIDIIPSVVEDARTKQLLQRITEEPFLVKSSIAIPNTASNSWLTNNPRGYVKWFDEELEKFHKKYILENRSNTIYESIEELPVDDSNNMLLNVVKILKRTRDVFYYRRKSEGKPASIIITTIVGKLARNLTPTSNELDLFKQVLIQLQQLKEYPVNNLSKRMDITGYAISNIITRDMGEWKMCNPANGKDNILSSWNEDENKVKEFFAWLDNLQSIFSKDLGDEEITRFYNAFAIEEPESDLRKAHFSVTNDTAKPWRKND